jgi:glycosyltransferase involved in cell wall biosynthesis
MTYLSILIPTYNRSNFLLKNLGLLTNFILRGNFQNEIEIIISDNNSKDETEIIVKQFQKKNNITLNYYKQKQNIGLEKNALFTLKQAKGNYVMFLGDDDYLEYEYLINSMKHLKVNKFTHCIVPSIINIDLNGEQTGGGRDLKLSNSITKAGFWNCLKNSWRGHQLSGLILKNDGLFEIYNQRKVQNIYLFIFLVALSCLKGDTLHFTQFPVRVTNPGQKNKDWTYEKDGLLNEAFDNYSKLPINFITKSILQLNFYMKQSWRLWMYGCYGYSGLIRAFYNILFSKNSTFVFKVFFPIIVFAQVIKKLILRLRNK